MLEVFIGLIPAILALFSKIRSAYFQNSLPMIISEQRERHTRFAHALIMPPLFLALTFENKFEKMKKRKRRSVRFATQTSVYSDPVQNFENNFYIN